MVTELAAACSKIGWEVTVLAPGETSAADSAYPFKLVRMGHRGKQDWLARFALLRFMRRRGIGDSEHLVIAEPAALRALLYEPLFRIPGFSRPTVILHGTEILRFSFPPYRKALFRRLLDRSEKIHVLSSYNAKLLDETFPNLSTPVVVAPGGPSIAQPPDLSVGIKGKDHPDKVIILTVGRIHPRKGQLEALLALSRLPTEDQKLIHYRIVGPSVRSKYREKLLDVASRCHFPVEFTGPVSEEQMAAEYQQADIFALTSKQSRKSIEGFGLVYLDASASSLPIVATRSGGIPEAVEDEVTGLLAAENDVEGLTERFRRLIHSPTLRQELGTNGKRMAFSQSWTNCALAIWGESTRFSD